MNRSRSVMRGVVVLLVSMIISASSCPAQDEKPDENLMIREAGNPVTSLINLPVQENISFGIGEYDRTMHVINIQPIRFSLRASSVHRIRSRTIIPLVYAPDVTSPSGGTFGLSDIIITGFFSPRQFGRFLWGAGPVISFPTATDPKVGTGKWSAGPSLVLGAQRQRWLAGIIAFNIWSFAGKADRADVNRLQIDALFRYHLGNRWILVSSPTIVADWKAPPGNKWIVPVGGGIGRIWLVDGKGIGFECQAFYNAVHPDDFPSADWTLRFQVQFIGSARR